MQLVSPTSLAASARVWRSLHESYEQDAQVLIALGRAEEEEGVWSRFRRRVGLYRLRTALVLGTGLSQQEVEWVETLCGGSNGTVVQIDSVSLLSRFSHDEIVQG
eukprot:Tamp_13754.p1 GENE.Tamp_13754~~Tamp_13754.p1  ORF type:complete len:105 (+),score=5.89 Tamp_13754:935-1249(+)